MADFTYKSNAAAIFDALDESALAGVTKLTNSIRDAAKERCPVGRVTRSGHTWKERRPGLLKSTIFSRVRVMKDGTDDVVGWVKAGTQGAPDNLSAFYAPFVEFGTQKWPGGNPFMRPSFRAHSAEELLDIVALEFSSVRRTGVKR